MDSPALQSIIAESLRVAAPVIGIVRCAAQCCISNLNNANLQCAVLHCGMHQPAFPPNAASPTRRQAGKDLTIDGFTVQQGTQLSLSLDQTHNDATAFPEPQSMCPLRFVGSANAAGAGRPIAFC